MLQDEIEVKFLNVDHQALRVILRNAGAICELPMQDMRRVIFDQPDRSLNAKDAHVRVRDEGHRVTMTYKQLANETVDGMKEIEVTVSDYDAAVALLKASGLDVKSVQESRREIWRLNNCEVVLDEWPWIKPYIEIEGPSEAALRKVAADLGFDWSSAVFGSVSMVYRAEYDIPRIESAGDWTEIRFDMPVPSRLQQLKRASA